ncbi:MAG: ribose-phosphate pyrophosphokinase [Solitalea-like symbiont of Tyrophagus putrescentiae]
MPSYINPVKVFSGSASSNLSNAISNVSGLALGDILLQRFSDGEFQPLYNESIRGSDVFLIQSTYAPSDNLLELLLMIDAAKRASAHYITAVIPYFGLARQDRKDKPRVSIGAKLVANLLNKAGAHRIITMDLHAAQIQGFFDIPVDNLDPSVIFIPYIKSLEIDNLVIASPDMGSTNRARIVAKHLNVDVVICDKQRKRANEVESMTIIGDVKDQNVIIIDDICDTGNTLAKAAQLIIEQGAKSVRAICTHAVLSGKAYKTIDESCLTELIVSDTIPIKNEIKKIKIISSSNLFARAIKNVYENASISDLFNVTDNVQSSIYL